MKKMLKQIISALGIAILALSLVGTAMAATPNRVAVPKSVSDAFGADIKSTDRILYVNEIITDEQTLLQRAKDKVMDINILPRITVQGIDEDQIIGYTTQKVMERVTEDGIRVESVRATVILAGTGSTHLPGNASNLLYYSITGDYELYRCSLWSGYKYKVTGAEAEYISNESGGTTGIRSWSVNVAVPTGGYYLSNGSYNSNAHPVYNLSSISEDDPYPGDTLTLTYSRMRSQINNYGTYCYTTTRVSLGIFTIKGNSYTLYFDL